VILVVVICVLTGGLMWWMQRRGVGRRRRWERERYLAYLEQLEEELGAAAATQTQRLATLYPDDALLAGLVSTRRRVWERRRIDPDHLTVALGRGRVPLSCPVTLPLNDNPLVEYEPDLLGRARALVTRWSELEAAPVVLGLLEHRQVAVAGGAHLGRALARHVVCQLAVTQGPDDVQVAVIGDAAAATDWEWAKWLPHARRVRSHQDSPRLLGFDPRSITSVLADAVGPRLAAAQRERDDPAGSRAVPSMPDLLLVVDGQGAADAVAMMPGGELLSMTGSAVSVLWLAGSALGATARVTVREGGALAFEEIAFGGARIEPVRATLCSTELADRIARGLAPLLLDEREGGRDLSEEVRLVELLGMPAQAIDADRAWRETQGPRALRIPLGVRLDGQHAILDLKEAAEGGMGPHGLVVGATGSGKSELLRTIVTALAIGHDPDLLNFVFVDFKGGASFADLARLPHCAGMITNIERDLTLVDRMQAALYGEQERRQRLLREAGNLDDIRQYRARRQAGVELPPMPYLLIVVDEFGELLGNRPDFLDLFVTLGRVGRSLGMHLLLATQRLDEGRIRGLEGHLRYRVCLRTFSAEESMAVLGNRDAFHLPPYPGVGYLRVDGDPEVFKVALVSRSDRADAGDGAVVDFSSAGPEAAASHPRPEAESGDTDMDVIISRIAGLRPPAHQVWLPPLPANLDLADVLARDARTEHLKVPIGMVDVPRAQRQDPLVLDFSGVGGHLAVVGAPQSGKSTLLRTLLAAFITTHDPADVQFYCVDVGGGTLRSFEPAPHVGAVAGKADRERILRVIQHVGSLIEERELLFRERALEGMAAYRRERTAGRLPGTPYGDVFLVIDDLAQVQSEIDQVEAELIRIATAGLSYGIHLVITAHRWGDVRARLRDAIGSRLELRLNDPTDSEIGRLFAASLPVGAPGRGLIRPGLHFQAAVAPPPEGLVEAARAAAAGRQAPRVHSLPGLVHEEELGRLACAGTPIGLESGRLEPVVLDMRAGDPHLLVFGDGQSGKTNLLRVIARDLAARTSAEESVVSLVDYRRQLADAARLPHVRSYCWSPAEASRLVAELLARLGAREPAPLGELWRGPHDYLLVDDYDWVATPAGNPLGALADLALQGHDIGFHVVLARRVGGSVRASFEPFFQRVREMGPPGLIMSGDPYEGPVLAGQKAEPMPPGRGWLVRRGHKTLQVQTLYATIRPAMYEERPETASG
jgi:S-DNA-T family DNA segregation ATPase FtsK/SpoIIIE